MPLDHALHPTWLAAPSAQPQFTRPPGWSRDSCRWPWRRTAAGNAYCSERRTYAVANEFRKGHPARRHHCVSHDAVFAGPCRAREQVSIRRWGWQRGRRSPRTGLLRAGQPTTGHPSSQTGSELVRGLTTYREVAIQIVTSRSATPIVGANAQVLTASSVSVPLPGRWELPDMAIDSASPDCTEPRACE